MYWYFLNIRDTGGMMIPGSGIYPVAYIQSFVFRTEVFSTKVYSAGWKLKLGK